MKLSHFKNKKILILGFGKEGKSSLFFLRKMFPKNVFGVADRDEKLKDKRIKDVKWHLGENYLEAIKDYDIVIKSPGIPIHLPALEKGFSEGKITSQTEIFLKHYKGKVIGITGTKGKSTTSSLIYKILKESKRFKVHLAGNIGKPVLYYLKNSNQNEILVCELSSHQLYHLKVSPHIAVFLNIYLEHLDYYKDFHEYLMAKANITLWQRKEDFFIYNANDENINKIAKMSKAKKIPVDNPSKVLKEIGIERTHLRGIFYQWNIACAIEVAKIFSIKKEEIKKAIEKFQPLPHRLEYVGKFKGIEFFNDSLSTIPQTTICALDALGERVQTLILGGFDRGLDFYQLAQEIITRKIPNIILFPDTGNKIWKEILKIVKDDEYLPKAIMVQNMKDAVKEAFRLTQENKICLLSPASPSFGLFKDYKERGNLFKKYVRYYGKKT